MGGATMAIHRKPRGDDDSQPKFTSKEPHHFFKIIVESSLRDGKINIPMKFLSKVGDEMPSRVKLHVPCGTVWKVEVTKSTNGEVWFQNGWKEFAEHYSLSHGHLIVFRYEGDGQFNVVIFDMTASEIDYPSTSTHGEASNGRREETGDDVYRSVGISDSAKRHCGKRREKSPLKCPKPSKSMRTISAYEKVGVGVHRTCSIRENRRSPSYRVVMKPTYIDLRNCTLNIPSEFARKHLKEGSAEVRLWVPDGRSWDVKYRLDTSVRVKARFTTNWKTFVHDNKLNVGDSCTFELIKGPKISFNVLINRAAEEANHESVTGYQGKIEELRSKTGLQNTQKHSFADTSASNSTKYPFFQVVVQPGYLNHGFMRIPRSFAGGYLNKIDAGWVTLETASGSWPVRLYCGNQFTISAGWTAFARENSVQQGDICTFELIKRSDLVFKVSVFRHTT